MYPPLARIRPASLAIAVAVAEVTWEEGLAQAVRPEDPEWMIEGLMYNPEY